MKRKLCGVMAIVIAAAVGTTGADNGCYSPAHGMSMLPEEKTAIRLLSEKVDFEFPWGEADPVTGTARLVLVNETDKPQTLKVGLRGFYGSWEWREVDGKKMNEDVEERDAFGGVPPMEIKFAPGEKHEFLYSFEGHPQFGENDTGIYWQYYFKIAGQEFWSGEVSETTVTAHFPADAPPRWEGKFDLSKLKIDPKPETIKDRTATWAFKGKRPEMIRVGTDVAQ